MTSIYPPGIQILRYNEVICIVRGQGDRLRFLIILYGLSDREESIALRVEFSIRDDNIEDHKASLARADATYTAMEYSIDPDISRFIPVREHPPKLYWQKSLRIRTQRDGVAQMDYISVNWEKSLRPRPRNSNGAYSRYRSEMDCFVLLETRTLWSIVLRGRIDLI